MSFVKCYEVYIHCKGDTDKKYREGGYYYLFHYLSSRVTLKRIQTIIVVNIIVTSVPIMSLYYEISVLLSTIIYWEMTEKGHMGKSSEFRTKIFPWVSAPRFPLFLSHTDSRTSALALRSSPALSISLLYLL